MMADNVADVLPQADNEVDVAEVPTEELRDSQEPMTSPTSEDLPRDEESEQAFEQDTIEPDHLLCPISSCLLRDPVVIVSGQTYERTAILDWWRVSGSPHDPMSNTLLESDAMIPNWNMRQQVAEFLEKHRSYIPIGWEDRTIPPAGKPRISAGPSSIMLPRVSFAFVPVFLLIVAVLIFNPSRNYDSHLRTLEVQFELLEFEKDAAAQTHAKRLREQAESCVQQAADAWISPWILPPYSAGHCESLIHAANSTFDLDYLRQLHKVLVLLKYDSPMVGANAKSHLEGSRFSSFLTKTSLLDADQEVRRRVQRIERSVRHLLNREEDLRRQMEATLRLYDELMSKEATLKRLVVPSYAMATTVVLGGCASFVHNYIADLVQPSPDVS